MKNLVSTIALMGFASASVGAASAAELSITAFYSNESSLFPVASILIEGPEEMILVDAQFEKDDATQLVEMIRASGKTLTTVFISHKDPDFYFGVDTIRAAFPDARIVATPSTVEGISQTIQLKYDFWGPILGDNAPTDLIVPEVLEGDSLTVDGETVQIIGLDGHDPKHTFLWVPDAETVLGGVPLYENQHVWMSDTQTVESRDDWRMTLDVIEGLNPKRIIAGHSVGESAEDISIVEFTRSYVAAFEAAAAEAANSEELVAAMQAAYPDFAVNGSLEIGAAVLMGERSWP